MLCQNNDFYGASGIKWQFMESKGKLLLQLAEYTVGPLLQEYII